MAKDKKSIIVYADWIHTFEELSDQEAGVLIKHFFRYVNDMNPEPPDKLTRIAFEPIKQQLKRDLNKWDEAKELRSESGQLGNLKRWNIDLYNKVVKGELTINQAIEKSKHRKTSQSDKGHRKASQDVANIAVNDNVNVTVNVNDNVINNNLLLEDNFEILKSNQIWVTNCQKSYGLSPEQFNKAIEAFKAKCIVACEDQSVSGLMRYFSNWFPINKDRIFKQPEAVKDTALKSTEELKNDKKVSGWN